MVTLARHLELSGNPFEHYTAETEPHITEYAVRPPYLESIADRVNGLSSFILFGDRGAGKSATRITVFNQIWGSATARAGHPLLVNFTDFTGLIPLLRRGALSDGDIIEAVSFVVVEQLLLRLSSMTDDDRETLLGALTKSERALCHELVSDFYLTRPEMERQFRTREAFKILNSAITTTSAIWLSQRWDAVSGVIASIVSILSKKGLDDEGGLGPATAGLLKSLQGDAAHAGRAVLDKLVQFSRVFGFTGIVVFVDKVDETELTTNSVEATTKLIYPLVSHIQLLEVDGFAWHFFLCSKVKSFLDEGEYKIRLDKIANALIAWDKSDFRRMLDARIRFFSSGKSQFSSLFFAEDFVDVAFAQICEIAMGSPRELVKIMDIIVREHDANQLPEHNTLLNEDSLNAGLDKYVKDVINTVLNERSLGQIYRIKQLRFINRDVQTAFRVGDQSARAKIKAWEDAGLIRFSGTRAAEGDYGGKPSNEYAIADARIERIMRRDLVAVEELEEEVAVD